MKAIAEHIRARLIADTAVKALVVARVYAVECDQNTTRPYIVYDIRFDGADNTLSRDQFISGVLEVRSVGASLDASWTLAEVVYDCLQGHSASTPYIGSILLRSQAGEYSPPADGKGKGEKWVTQVYEITTKKE